MRWWEAFGVAAALIALGIALIVYRTHLADDVHLGQKFASSLEITGAALLLSAVAFLVWHFGRYIRSLRHRIELLEAQHARQEQDLHWKDTNQAIFGIERAKALWESSSGRQCGSQIYEDDPVYLQLALDPSLSDIIAQPIVQRLNHIRQLSFAYLAFRSATHTRLAHSLGACRNAQVVMRKVFQDGYLYTKEGRLPIGMRERKAKGYTKLAMITALLHDLGHGPLSHALDIHIGLGSARKTAKPDREYSIQYI